MKRRWLKPTSIVTLVIFLNQILYPSISFALTGGPTQPEVHGFEPVNSTQMVDLFTGDFTYNIPLMDIGGYPINLSYHAGVGMEQEASMVGLGWSLTPGAINRNVRGIPDDFNGDEVTTQVNIKPNNTWGIGAGAYLEIFGFDVTEKLNLNVRVGRSMEIYNNSYRGIGTKLSSSVGLSYRAYNGSNESESSLQTGVGLNITSDSKSGITLNPNIYAIASANHDLAERGYNSNTVSTSFGMRFQSNSGLESVYLMSSSTNAKTKFDPSRSVNGGGYSSKLGYSAYFPSMSNNMLNYNAGIKFSYDATLVGASVQLQANGYFSSQWLADKEMQNAAYGNLYYTRMDEKNSNSKGNDKLLDFNRISDNQYEEGSMNINLSQTTYDIYSISGQGTGGNFRLHQSDIPFYGEPMVQNRSVRVPSAEVGLEFGPTTRVGVNGNLSYFDLSDGAWNSDDGNNVTKNNANLRTTNVDRFFEPTYFIKDGEMTPIEQFYLDQDLGTDPVRLEFDKSPLGEYRLTNSLVNNVGHHGNIGTLYRAQNREYKRRYRNSTIEYLTNFEASRYGLNRDIYSYDSLITTTMPSGAKEYETDHLNPFSRTPVGNLVESNTRKGHHIGSFKITEENGTRYVYDIPGYNYESNDVSFDITDKDAGKSNHFYYKEHLNSGLIDYTSTDASTLNNKGIANYYNKRSIPAYAYTHYLTGILSPDYIDLTGDGISEDDMGSAVKFNYTLHSNEYGWRAPYGKNKAKYIPGLLTKPGDDKATYSYGIKELWFVHSIESKTHIAEFYYSERDDALGVSDESGTKGTTSEQKTLKLDRIVLYNKLDRFNNKENATPIKVVYFTYTYDLCKGVPNQVNSGFGKLTLKKISFSYGKSYKSMMSPYIFSYSSVNPDYTQNVMDSWGNYKPDNATLSNTFFPYPDQNKSAADANASAWSLTQIKLPSGGKINIEYESDDYAYVMEKEAHTMREIKGFSIDSTYIDGLDYSALYNDIGHNYYMFFELGTSIGSNQEVIDKYWPENGQLFYKCMTYLRDKNEPELMSGFAEVANMGVCAKNPTIGWVRVKSKNTGRDHKKQSRNKVVNPISYNSWNFIMKNLNEKIFSNSELPAGDHKTGLDKLMSSFDDLIGFIAGKYVKMEKMHFARVVDLSQCVIRLKDPDHFKIGGGLRVKQLTMTDNWSKETSDVNEDGVYGSVYSYVKQEKINGVLTEISSGVASFETQFATDENPYISPITISVNKIPSRNNRRQAKRANNGFYKLFAHDEQVIGPIGDAFYPNPMVGYSKVRVQSLASSENKGTGTGYTESEYYTTRDFPIRIEQTPLVHEKRGSFFLTSWLLGTKWYKTAVSQGYTVYSNNMSGRPKSMSSYDKFGHRVSGTRYEYKLTKPTKADATASNDNDKNEVLWLDNKVKVLDRTGAIKERTIGGEYDISVDTKASRDLSIAGGMSSNFDVIVLFGVPLPIPTLYFGTKYEKNKFNSVSVTKLVQQYGILEKVIAYDEQSTVETKNLLWDEETGAPILTVTTNEYNDQISNFSYPAHFAYNELSSPSKNTKLKFNRLKVDNGTIAVVSPGSKASAYFAKGDVLACRWLSYENSGNIEIEYTKFWVKGIKDNKIFIVDKHGVPPTGNIMNMVIAESGYKNMLSATIQSFTTMEKVDLSGASFTPPSTVIQTSASTLSDNWQTYNDEYMVEKCTLDTGIAYPLLRVLNAMNNLSWLDTTVTAPGLKKNFQMWRAPGFKGSKLANKLRKYTKYVVPVSGTCTEEAYVDTHFVYKLYTWEGDAQRFVEFTQHNRPSEQSLAHYKTGEYRGYELYQADPINRKRYLDCDSAYRYANFIALEDSNLNKTSFEFSMGRLGESFDDPYCHIKLFSPDSIPFPLKSITSFSNIRLNKFIDNGYDFFVDVVVDGQTITLQGNTCIDLRKCWNECVLVDHDTINPYLAGTRGKWRTKDQFAYYADRDLAGTITDYDTRTMSRLDGTYSFSPLWSFDYPNSGLVFNGGTNWISPETLKKATPNGNLIESEDALGRKTTEVFGYSRSLVIASAQNAAHHEVAFDGFEDYDFPFYDSCRKEPHWAFQQLVQNGSNTLTLSSNPVVSKYLIDHLTYLSKDYAHTGMVSLHVPENSSLNTTDLLFDTDTNTYNRRELEPYMYGMGNVIQKFAPERGKRYIVTAWVHETESKHQATFDNAYIRVKVDGTTYADSFYASGPIIDGWQRISGEVNIPADVGGVSITIAAVVNGANGAYFDDIRLQPFSSAMKSYVYHPVTLKLTSELDENNFATFYEYDAEGRLLRIKKETEEGIVTLQETRYGIPKKH